jgi:hypothetical protein
LAAETPGYVRGDEGFVERMQFPVGATRGENGDSRAQIWVLVWEEGHRLYSEGRPDVALHLFF